MTLYKQLEIIILSCNQDGSKIFISASNHEAAIVCLMLAWETRSNIPQATRVCSLLASRLVGALNFLFSWLHFGQHLPGALSSGTRKTDTGYAGLKTRPLREVACIDYDRFQSKSSRSIALTRRSDLVLDVVQLCEKQ